VSPSLKILIVEDSPADCKLVLQELKRSGLEEIKWERVETAQAMRDALINETWDVIISDWSMPKFSATESLRLLRETGADIPFIIVSGTVGEELAVEAMRAGAQDYVLKDRLTRLLPAIEREVREAQMRESRRRAEASLQKSETRFARLAESGIVGICIADVLGNVHEANDAYLEMIGYTRDDLLSGKVGWAAMTPPNGLLSTKKPPRS
jgi:DNA-binding NtrC family response regulator